MEGLTRAWTIAVVAVFGMPLLYLLGLVSEAAQRATSFGWLVVIWLIALATWALGSSPSSRLVRASRAWFACVCLATLAGDGALTLMWLLVGVLLLSGAAQLLDIPFTRPTVLQQTTTSLPEIMLTDLDLDRLTRMLEGLGQAPSELAQALESEIARAQIVAATKIPGDVVTMNSRVVFEELETRTSRVASIVYPQDADAAEGRISVLAPVGSALLGLRVGQSIEWALPRGRRRRYRVVEIAYQPEAAGDFNL